MTPPLSQGAFSTQALDRLEQQVGEIGDLQSKLILLVGNSGKTRLLRALAQRLNVTPINVSLELGHRLAAMPVSERSFSAHQLLREITCNGAHGDIPLLLDNLEVLFEPSLKINPLDLIKRLAHSRRVVAVWPGEIRGNRLVYASIGHPEHRDYSLGDAIVFDMAQGTPGTRT
ncbi:MAG: BREX-3 system P-loop-containing protein BrxF [Lautropia sp.]|nr:BREX-3 system P-loop-containing protein BrxF [Lautropia sp.]